VRSNDRGLYTHTHTHTHACTYNHKRKEHSLLKAAFPFLSVSFFESRPYFPLLCTLFSFLFLLFISLNVCERVRDVNVSVVRIEAEWRVNNPELPSGDALEGLSVVPKALLVLRRYRLCAFSVSDMRRPLFPVLKKVHFVHRPNESRARDAINDLRWKARFCHRENAWASVFPPNARLGLSLSLWCIIFMLVLGRFQRLKRHQTFEIARFVAHFCFIDSRRKFQQCQRVGKYFDPIRILRLLSKFDFIRSGIIVL